VAARRHWRAARAGAAGRPERLALTRTALPAPTRSSGNGRLIERQWRVRRSTGGARPGRSGPHRPRRSTRSSPTAAVTLRNCHWPLGSLAPTIRWRARR
jgi:hypothetical protein